MGGVNAISHLRRVARDHPHIADVAVAAVVWTAVLLTTVSGPAPGQGQLSAEAVLFATVACGVLVARRYRPLPVLAVSVVGAESYTALYHGNNGMLVLLAPLIALYTVADVTDRRRGLTLGALTVLVIAIVHALIKPSWLGPENLALVALGALAVAIGDASRNRRAYLTEVEARARRAEDDRDRDARRRVTEERLRIARDLHDSVGHHLALISVQSGVADQVLDASPDQAHQALAHVKTASRSALGELRETIGLLREAGETVAPTTPTVGLDGVADLLIRFSRSGLHVEHTVDGRVRRLPPAADLTAYRVIQESLTNVYKHADRPDARLDLSYQATALRITVDDNGTPSTSPTDAGEPLDGHGIVGMRERVLAVGGELDAGPRPGGGFRVRATLPFGALV